MEVIEGLETQKLADKESLKAMQEIVDNLTESKLETANRISDLEKRLSIANTQSAKVNDEVNALREHAIENESLKRQIKRLTDENEELISEMEQLEMRSKEEQAADVQKLEHLRSENEKLTEAMRSNDKFSIKLSDHQEQFDKISFELQETKDKNEKLIVELAAVGEQNAILTQHSRKQCDKLKLYKSKILEFSGKLKQLKSSKEVLAKIVAEYSQSVTKWQLDIISAMKQIESRSSTSRSNEMSPLQSESAKLELNANEIEEKIISLQTTNDDLSNQVEQLQKQLVDNSNSMLEKSESDEAFRTESLADKKTITELQSQLNRSIEDNQNLSVKIEELRNADETNRQKLVDDFEIERTKLLNDVDKLNETLDRNRMELNEKMGNLTSELNDYKIRANDREVEVNELRGALEQLQQKRSQENEELLSEMREINEALKNRGDVISKQKQQIGELNDKIDQLQQRIGELNGLNETANKQIEQLNDRVKEIESKTYVDGKNLASVQGKFDSTFPFHHFQILKCPYQPYPEPKKSIVCETLKKVSRKSTTNCEFWQLN